jgi:hypothetical protein
MFRMKAGPTDRGIQFGVGKAKILHKLIVTHSYSTFLDALIEVAGDTKADAKPFKGKGKSRGGHSKPTDESVEEMVQSMPTPAPTAPVTSQAPRTQSLAELMAERAILLARLSEIESRLGMRVTV